MTLETGTLEEILPDAPGGQWESRSAAPGGYEWMQVRSPPLPVALKPQSSKF